MADKKMELIVNVNVNRGGSAVAATSINTVGLIVTDTIVGTEPSNRLYSSSDEVKAVYGDYSEAYKMAVRFFSQDTHPDSVRIVKIASKSKANIVAAMDLAAMVDVFNWCFTLQTPATDSAKVDTLQLVKDLNAYGAENYKMLHVEFDVNTDTAAQAIRDIFEGFEYNSNNYAGLSVSSTRNTAIYVHNMKITEVKRKVVYGVALTAASAEGSKAVSVTVGSHAAYSASTTSGSTPATVATAIATAINADSTCEFGAEASNGVLTLTAKDGGKSFNDITVSAASTDSNVTISKTSEAQGEEAADHIGVSIVADRCGADPARGTWALKELVGDSPDEMSKSQLKAAQDTGYNVFTDIAKVSCLFMGTTCSATEFIDTMFKAYWLKFRTQEAVFDALRKGNEGYGNDMSDDGIADIGATVTRVLTTAFKNHYIMDGYKVSLPLYADIPQADKNVRRLLGIKATVKLMDSVHTVVSIDISAEK